MQDFLLTHRYEERPFPKFVHFNRYEYSQKVKLEVNYHDDWTLFLEKEFILRGEIDEIAITSSKHYAQRDENGRLSSKSFDEYDVLLLFSFDKTYGRDRNLEVYLYHYTKVVSVCITLQHS